MVPDGRDGRTHGRRQNYIPPTSSGDNMLWLALMSLVQNKHLPMLESGRYAVRYSQRLCSLCQELYHSVFFSLFLLLPVLKTTLFSGNFKANNGYFLQILA